MHDDYRHPVMRRLRDQQIRFAPREKKIQQIDRAERLIREIDRKKTYSYEYLCYRITDYRPESFPDARMAGDDALHDLRLFVEDVSDSAELAAERAPEPVLTVEQLSRKFNVSTKTISRWRRQGLVSRKFMVDGRKRVGFLQSSVEDFVQKNHDRVQRGARFSQLTEAQRNDILERARRLASAGGCQSDVIRRLAKRSGRSVETIRYTVRQFDKEHPDLAIFPDISGPLTKDAKHKIHHLYQQGNPVEQRAKRFCRTKTTIYRVINEMRYERVMQLPLEYIDSDEFRLRNADTVCLGPMPPSEATPRKARRPNGLPPYLASLYEVPLLSREQEEHIFRRFNYLKFKAHRLRQTLDPANLKASLMDEVEHLYQQAVEVKNRIIRANLRLVVSIAKRHVGQNENFFELVSDGNMSLMRAAEKFDYSRGNKFSTYASWAILKNFARTIPGEFKHRDRFRTSHDELFDATEQQRSNQHELEQAQLQREHQIESILERLDEREQAIIIHRFGLDHSQEPQTLKEVGAALGVTKERIRQIEARALNKLRLAAREENIVFEEEP